MSQQRIYIVGANDRTQVLVKATNQAQALRHVARNTYQVRVASALEVADHMGAGGTIGDATKEPESTTEDKE